MIRLALLVVGGLTFGVGAYSVGVYALAGWGRYRTGGVWTGRGIRERTPRRTVNPKDRPFAWRDGSTTGINPTPPTAA